LQHQFNTLIDRFIDTRVGIVDEFLSMPLAAGLKLHLLELHQQKQLAAAETGNKHKRNKDSAFRGDQISWLDQKNSNPFEQEFLGVIDKFVRYLNDTCYAGINTTEFHFTRYETGTCYKRHIDQFREDDHRQYSMIIYLNTEWQKGDGGELCIYHDDAPQMIEPTEGKCIFFKSNELEHEVLLTHAPRFSITGWLKKG
jgi:SM-20-related protein